MASDNPYRSVVARYLKRGAVGVSVGLASVAPAPAAPSADAVSAPSFSEKLAKIRSAVSEQAREIEVQLAQATGVGPIPRPPIQSQPFPNWGTQRLDPWRNFGNAWANVPRQ